MKLIQPITITTAMLSSSNVPETDSAIWDVGTAYVVGDRRIKTSTHRIYECLVNNTGFDPETNLTGVAPKWLDLSPTNRWAMFDDVVGTKTSKSVDITVTLLTGAINGLALLGCVGDNVAVTLKDSVGGNVVYTKTVSLDASQINSLFDWFFQPYEQKEDVVLTDLPFQYTTPELTVKITAGSSNAKIGVCKAGIVNTLGATQYGGSVGITDYSIKEIDAFGNYNIVPRAFAKKASFPIHTEHALFNRVFRKLTEVRATPCIWIGTEESGYEPLTIYGFYKDFSIDITYQDYKLWTLEIEGLT